MIWGISCSMPWLASFGKLAAGSLEVMNQYTGIPNNPKEPLQMLASTLCLDERVALAFTGAVMTGTVVIGTTLLGVLALSSCVRCKPMSACGFATSAVIGLTIAVPVYVAAKVLL